MENGRSIARLLKPEGADGVIWMRVWKGDASESKQLLLKMDAQGRNEAAQRKIVTYLTLARGDAGTRPPFLVASLPSKIFGIKSRGIGKDKCRQSANT